MCESCGDTGYIVEVCSTCSGSGEGAGFSACYTCKGSGVEYVQCSCQYDCGLYDDDPTTYLIDQYMDY